jgi:hypothetical protein
MSKEGSELALVFWTWTEVFMPTIASPPQSDQFVGSNSSLEGIYKSWFNE